MKMNMSSKRIPALGVLTIALLASSAALTGCAAGTPEVRVNDLPHVAPAIQANAGPLAPPSAEQAEEFGPLSEADAIFPENQNLTRESAQVRQATIDSRYRVGELLSAPDAEFIRIVAHQTPAMQSMTQVNEATTIQLASNIAANTATTLYFDKTRSGAGATGRARGNEYMNYSDNPFNINGNWSATINAYGSTNVTKIVCAEHVRVYGLIGSSGIGLAYAADPSGTTHTNSNSFYRSAPFVAYGAYWTMSYSATFYTTSGSFSVTG